MNEVKELYQLSRILSINLDINEYDPIISSLLIDIGQPQVSAMSERQLEELLSANDLDQIYLYGEKYFTVARRCELINSLLHSKLMFVLDGSDESKKIVDLINLSVELLQNIEYNPLYLKFITTDYIINIIRVLKNRAALPTTKAPEELFTKLGEAIDGCEDIEINDLRFIYGDAAVAIALYKHTINRFGHDDIIEKIWEAGGQIGNYYTAHLLYKLFTDHNGSILPGALIEVLQDQPVYKYLEDYFFTALDNRLTPFLTRYKIYNSLIESNDYRIINYILDEVFYRSRWKDCMIDDPACRDYFIEYYHDMISALVKSRDVY